LASNTSVEGILLTVIGLLLDKGNTFQLEAEILPSNASNKNIIWTSSNNSIAAVDNTGLVKAVGGGVASITATTEDGGYSDVC